MAESYINYEENESEVSSKLHQVGFCYHEKHYMVLKTDRMFTCTVKGAWPEEILRK